MKKILNLIVRLPAKVGIFLISLYQLIMRPIFPSACRFYPSCSVYTQQSIKKYGLIKGSLKGFHRISKCHPGHPGGVDEVV